VNESARMQKRHQPHLTMRCSKSCCWTCSLAFRVRVRVWGVIIGNGVGGRGREKGELGFIFRKDGGGGRRERVLEVELGGGRGGVRGQVGD